jgi:3-deoxy-D-arabino-heptulosonate 7-phosphate (DAHP) synthase class II
MSAANVPIFKGASNEKACMRVMSNLKFKSECLAELHNKVNKSLELIEAMIVKNPTDENKMLLLQTLELYERDKCVAQYEEAVIKQDEDCYDIFDADGNPVYVKDKKGNIRYVTVKIERYINCTDWTVSITRAKKVRVHLNAEAVESLTKQYSKVKDIKDFKVY